MAHRPFLTSLILALLLVCPALLAEELPQDIANSPNSAVGQINADSVYVRSGAGDNYYPTLKLNSGTQVTVVGVKFDWLKITPPQGSFSYIAKAFVDKGAGDMGTVNKDSVNVRAGSTLNAMKTTVQSKLSAGQQVKIVGEQDEYYKIAPPAEAYLFVKKQYVSFVKAIGQVSPSAAAPQALPPAEAAPIVTPLAETSVDAIAQATTEPSSGPTTQLAADVPSTQPVASAEVEFDKLEAKFATASAKPIEQQPVAALLGGYQKLIGDPELPESMRRIADFRAQTLKARGDARDQLVAIQKEQNEAKKRQQALKAEQDELAQQIKKTDVQLFTAVGVLRTSSLQPGEQVLYRLTDPQSGRSVCYIQSDDPKYGSFIGKFIGVKGELTTDPNLMLKVVKATDASVVDPNQLFRGVAPLIVPPSLLPSAAQQAASTGQ